MLPDVRGSALTLEMGMNLFIHGKLTVEFWTIDSKIAISRNIGLRPIKHNEKLFRISKLTIDILITFVFRDILIKYFSI